jgi:hypothetical protein
MMLTGCMPFNAATDTDQYYRFIAQRNYQHFWQIFNKAAPDLSPEVKELLIIMFESDSFSRLTL